MKRFLTVAIFLALILTGCNAPDKDVGGFQILADRSEMAKAYAQTLFEQHMSANNQEDYSIEETVWGFSTTDVEESVYMVAFRYNVNETAGIYGYKIFIDENENCSLKSEGIEIAEFLFGTNEGN